MTWSGDVRRCFRLPPYLGMETRRRVQGSNCASRFQSGRWDDYGFCRDIVVRVRHQFPAEKQDRRCLTDVFCLQSRWCIHITDYISCNWHVINVDCWHVRCKLNGHTVLPRNERAEHLKNGSPCCMMYTTELSYGYLGRIIYENGINKLLLFFSCLKCCTWCFMVVQNNGHSKEFLTGLGLGLAARTKTLLPPKFSFSSNFVQFWEHLKYKNPRYNKKMAKCLKGAPEPRPFQWRNQEFISDSHSPSEGGRSIVPT